MWLFKTHQYFKLDYFLERAFFYDELIAKGIKRSVDIFKYTNEHNLLTESNRAEYLQLLLYCKKQINPFC